ncbi:protein LKAAEAR1-like [Trichomycterus rosablanca]|uniref:protein LKAAEAR1-like n=1 Tax=Trichomycterus rosablanca TaxID=2290929 RepID=UPI002F353BC0
MAEHPETQKKPELKRMCPQQKARHLAYAEPSKEVQAGIAAAHQRAVTRQAQEKKRKPIKALDSKLRHELIGQLQAAEARNRIQQRRQQYENLKAQEINLMISCQSSAQSAMRLELLLAVDRRRIVQDSLDPLQRQRVEEIIEDEKDCTLIRG